MYAAAAEVLNITTLVIKVALINIFLLKMDLTTNMGGVQTPKDFLTVQFPLSFTENFCFFQLIVLGLWPTVLWFSLLSTLFPAVDFYNNLVNMGQNVTHYNLHFTGVTSML